MSTSFSTLKRARESEDDDEYLECRQSKRYRSGYPDRLSFLSDELLLRTLSFLPISDLIACERVSKRIRALACDPQIWKALYYDRFVLPRALRIPGIRNSPKASTSLFYASRRAKWLQDEHLVRGGKSTDWKRQYKLRHNWSRGCARVKETQIAESGAVPPLLIRLRKDLAFLADSTEGLRAWSMVEDGSLLTSKEIGERTPTCLAVDSVDGSPGTVEVVVGFLNGAFSAYSFSTSERLFTQRFEHPPPARASLSRSSNGEGPRPAISAIAYATPYLLTMHSESMLSLYRLKGVSMDSMVNSWDLPILVSSMKSHMASSPLALSLRTIGSRYVASVIFSISTLNNRRTVGMQELLFSTDGEILESRVATADPHSPLLLVHTPLELSTGIWNQPITSISYNHPYILTAHPDNTLSLFVVNSQASSLSIGRGQRLWGHTSSVSGAHIGERGKAVSVSSVGNDLRVWDLEFASMSERKTVLIGPSVQIRQSSRNSESLLSSWNAHTIDHDDDGDALIRRTNDWLTFDDEKVIVLRGHLDGPKALVTYDFT